MIVDVMEAAVKKQDGIVKEECRDLLNVAGTCIFSNLLLADPQFDLATALRRVEPSLPCKIAAEVKEAVDALLKLFVRKAETADEESDDASGEDVDDSGSSA